MSDNPLRVHRKATHIDKVLPPVAELLADLKHTNASYRNLDGQEKLFDFKELTVQDSYPTVSYTHLTLPTTPYV